MVLAAGKAGGVGVMLHQPANALVAFPHVGILEHFLAHHAVFGEAGDEPFGVAGVERPAIIGDQVLQAEAVLDGQFAACGHSPVVASTVTLVMIARQEGEDILGKIIVTGASGQFGHAAAKMLLERIPAEDLIVL